jgi:hypothetical protein
VCSAEVEGGSPLSSVKALLIWESSETLGVVGQLLLVQRSPGRRQEEKVLGVIVEQPLATAARLSEDCPKALQPPLQQGVVGQPWW